MDGKFLFRALLTGLLLTTLVMAGCEGDDGRDGINAIDAADGQSTPLPAAEAAGLLACSTCHGTSTAAADWKNSLHAMNSSHSISSCATACHNPSGAMYDIQTAFGVVPTGTVVGCEDCHGGGSNHINQPNAVSIANTAPGTAVCAQCHDGAQHASRHVFASEIASRFGTSRHANQHARTGFCSACHSHEGGVLLLSQERFTDIEDFAAFYNSTNVPHFNLPEAEEGVEGVNGKQCATCHDPHKAALRGQGDVLIALEEPFTKTVDGVDVTVKEDVVFSAEFNLCTACHMVDLDATEEGHGDAGALFSYELSDKYLKANLVNAETSTWKEVDIDGRGLTKVSNVFYHDGTSANNRHFVDTHFGGTIYSSLVNIGDADTEFADLPIKGYNINAANKNACTVCHDPHTGGKMLSPAEPENNDNSAIAYAEGLGDFHTNYLGAAQGHGCTPCHSGDAFVPLTTRGIANDAPKTSVIGCRTCHNLAQPNAAPGSNNVEAFAAVREFQPEFVFAFNSGVEVPVAELGVNQICFECHKGRNGVKEGADTTTQVYGVSYLHYAPAFATLFGNDSAMVPVYDGETYAGRFAHYDGTEFGCVDCHNVHDTNGNEAVLNKMQNPDFTCNGCHGAVGSQMNADFLKDRTVAYGQRLRETIIDEYNDRFDPDIDAAGFHSIMAGRNAASEIGDNDLAVAASIYKIFNYEDGSPYGTENGHGGSWAHNSKFARQVQYDAIDDLGGDLTDLPRP